MIVARIIAVSGLAVMSGICIAQNRVHSPVFGDVLEYPTAGCNGAVLHVPLPGRQFAAVPMSLPTPAEGFFEKAARLNVRWLTDMNCIPTGHTHKLQPGTGPIVLQRSDGSITNGYVSTNWSGYQISESPQFAQSGWVIPTIVHPRPPYASSYYSSTWTGIGGGFGSGSGPLIQAGSEQDLSGGAPSYSFWYEIVGGSADTGQALGVSLPASAGDSAGSVVIWQPSAPGSNVGPVTFGLCNFRYATCVNIYLGQSPSSPQSQRPGDSTEWIVEAPTVNGFQSYIADFDSVNFQGDCWAPVYQTGATCLKVSDGASPTQIFLYQYVLRANQLLAAPDTLNADGTFTDLYYQPEYQN